MQPGASESLASNKHTKEYSLWWRSINKYSEDEKARAETRVRFLESKKWNLTGAPPAGMEVIVIDVDDHEWFGKISSNGQWQKKKSDGPWYLSENIEGWKYSRLTQANKKVY